MRDDTASDPPAPGTCLQAIPASHQPRPTIQPGTAGLQLPLMFVARKEHPQAGQAGAASGRAARLHSPEGKV